MLTELDRALPGLEEEFQKYVAEVEPLVARTVPEIHDDEEAFLGRLCELLPSRPRTAQDLTQSDEIWLAALEHVIHRHQLSYALVGHASGDDELWLVPQH